MSTVEVGVLVEAAGPSTVSVATRSCEGSTRGSGVVSGDSLITSAHLVADGARIDVGGDARWSGSLAVTGYWPAVDLAAASIGEQGAWRAPDHGLRLAEGSPRPGDPVVVLARPDGVLRWLAATVGAVVAGGAYGIDSQVLLLDEAVVPGWSGGPVLDRTGDVVGVVSGVDRTTGLTVAVSLSSDALMWPSNDKKQTSPDC